MTSTLFIDPMLYDNLISTDWGSISNGTPNEKPEEKQVKYVKDNFETIQMHRGFVLVRNKVTGEQKWCSQRACWEYQPNRITAGTKEERAEEFYDADPHRMP